MSKVRTFWGSGEIFCLSPQLQRCVWGFRHGLEAEDVLMSTCSDGKYICWWLRVCTWVDVRYLSTQTTVRMFNVHTRCPSVPQSSSHVHINLLSSFLSIPPFYSCPSSSSTGGCFLFILGEITADLQFEAALQEKRLTRPNMCAQRPIQRFKNHYQWFFSIYKPA